MTPSVTIHQANDRIDDFCSRYRAGVGDPQSSTPTEADVQWIKGQEGAWPYGEPNLFRFALEAVTEYVRGGGAGILVLPEKPALLKELFGFPEDEIQDFVEHCPSCLRRI